MMLMALEESEIMSQYTESIIMSQEPASRPHRLARVIDQSYPADDAAVPLLYDPHPVPSSRTSNNTGNL